MKTNQRLLRLMIVASTIIIAFAHARTQTVIQLNSTGTSLADRWKLAKTNAQQKGFDKGYWAGYSIQRSMGERSFIGSFYSDRSKNRPTLGEIVTGMKNEGDFPDDFSIGDNTNIHGTMTFGDGQKPERKIIKEVGILFHLRGDSHEIDDMEVSNLSLHVDLEQDPLIWLGSADHRESVSFLESAYGTTAAMETKKDFMMAISLHEESKRAVEFLTKILQSSEHPDVREDAAFWLGQTQTREALTILTETAKNDKSDDVREKAIFAISQIDGESSTGVLIDLARHHRDGEMRKKAAFWLGQKASEKAVGALKELAYEDKDTEVQRNAVFALTQIDDGESVDELIKIARMHPNPKIRKEAIFWLGQCENPKALEALIDIIKK